MASKKQKRKTSKGKWQLPQHVEDSNAFSIELAAREAELRRPIFPQLRFILAGLGMSLLCLGIFLALLLPAKALTDDLDDRGITTSAVVTEVDDKPKHMKVRFDNSNGTTKADMSEFAGMLPDVKVGENLRVTYDSEDPSRVLSQAWVENPPYLSLPILGTAALTLLCTALMVAVILRRRWYLRTFGPPPPRPKKPKGKASTDLTKP
ncbi:DUF3592 domain-containing protein [Streptomyces sp. NPDC048484]|uniref:DUF3592 domain-containing protein n=1 Tax=Streptomyces sp. NPDC048484 TaxID=3155146 RepID=UPI00342ECA45